MLLVEQNVAFTDNTFKAQIVCKGSWHTKASEKVNACS